MAGITVFPVCPHCGAKNMTFHYVDRHEDMTFWYCAGCGGGVCAVTSQPIPDMLAFPFYNFIRCYPTPKECSIPNHAPEKVAKYFKEAKNNLDAGNYISSAIMARKTVEAAISPMTEKKLSLSASIKQLGTQGILTPALVEWAHEIRIIGNEAAHGDDATPADAAQAVYFAEMLLLYLYTIPGMIAERRTHAKE